MMWSGGWRSGQATAPAWSRCTWPEWTELLTPDTMASTSPAQSPQRLRSDQPPKRRRPATVAVLEPKVPHPPLLHLHGQGRRAAGEQDRGELGEVGLVSDQGQGGDVEMGLDHLDDFGGGATGLQNRLRFGSRPARLLLEQLGRPPGTGEGTRQDHVDAGDDASDPQGRFPESDLSFRRERPLAIVWPSGWIPAERDGVPDEIQVHGYEAARFMTRRTSAQAVPPTRRNTFGKRRRSFAFLLA